LERVDRLVRAIQTTPFAGIGKPEPLRGDLSGWWSRRTSREHRLVYRVERGVIYILQARYHY
jgi:toxin YoeB